MLRNAHEFEAAGVAWDLLTYEGLMEAGGVKHLLTWLKLPTGTMHLPLELPGQYAPVQPQCQNWKHYRGVSSDRGDTPGLS